VDTLTEAQRVMNWSRSIVALQWVRASAPAGCSPRGLGGVDDSFEGFNIFMLRDAPVREVDQDLARLYRTTLTHPLG
jgi:hypothetical protein